MADVLFIYVLCVGSLNGVVGSLRWRTWLGENARVRFLWLGAALLNLAWTVAALELLTYPAPVVSLGVRWYVAAMGVTYIAVAVLLEPLQGWWRRR